MLTEREITIDAPPSHVWRVYADVERWPEWTASVTKVVALDGPDLAVGHRFKITQPKLPTLVWVVTEVEPGRSWSWQQRSFGSTTIATHEVDATGDHSAHVRLGIDQHGLLGTLFARVSRRLTRRYLDLEAEGLAQRSVETCAPDGTSA